MKSLINIVNGLIVILLIPYLVLAMMNEDHLLVAIIVIGGMITFTLWVYLKEKYED